ncbi:hypothetical protein [Haloferula sp.]|uniref:hypothetical protein n=1 Tax=Haloferula sp. TaxID=2497595 RepID=UPI00329C678A
MKRPSLANLGCFAAVLVVAFLLFGGAILREVRTSPGRQALPSSAANIEEALAHHFVGGDFTRLLKADLTESDFSGYAKSLGLTERFDPEVHQHIEPTLNRTIGDAPAWWNPPEVDSTTFFDYEDGEDYLRVLRYRGGSVFLLVQSW